MKISIIATTKVGHKAEKEEFDKFSGKAAGVCYMASSFEDLLNEEEAKTLRRVKQTKDSGHHSVYDHNSISLYLENVPKIIAMIINNEHQYTTSEKSARYTKMELTDKEQIIYNKWLEIFKNKITKLYKEDYPTFFTDSRIEKLAQENARYLISVFTPTFMVYTTTYRQLNVLISLMDKYISEPHESKFELRLVKELTEFVAQLKSLPYYDETLTRNEKCRSLSLFNRGFKVEEYFGDVYATSYMASFAELAQAQRHRTLNYSIKVLEGAYFIPPIIKDSVDLSNLWLSDLQDLAENFPQAMLCEVSEQGTLDNFILKLKERKCTYAQLEINQLTIATLNKYEYALRLKNHPRAMDLVAYTKGSRCTFPDYTCTAPCGFALGINETRKI